MLSFQNFFVACAGFWTTERTYHSVLEGQIERSYTEFRVETLTSTEKQRILSLSDPAVAPIKVDVNKLTQDQQACPGFAIAFDTRSETGETVAMSLKALFVPDDYVLSTELIANTPPPPVAAQVAAENEVIQGFYLRDEGYSEAGAIAGRFTYQPMRQTLEMTTYYKRSVAVDQMRIVAPNLRLRTIVTYQRPAEGEVPTAITLVGFGVEHKTTEHKTTDVE